MDKSAIKNYAVAARKKLIEAVTLKAQQLYIFEDSTQTLRSDAARERLRADEVHLSLEQLRAREHLFQELLFESIPYKPEIFHRKMEEVAYTWFNRLIALRFMEVNDYLPDRIRILSSVDAGRIEPDALRDIERLDYVNPREIARIKADEEINVDEKVYKHILISRCNSLSSILPGTFQKIDDYTELLLPDALYKKGGIVHDLVNDVPEDNFRIAERGQIEIIGWLYQYYISEKKDEVFANLKKNIKINKDTIPAATQLFTPEWIVKYMVENSLGRLWFNHCPPGMAHGNAEDALRELWIYYIEEAEQEYDVEEKLRKLNNQFTFKDPTEIKLIDPCMGSGHILVYAFDVLFQIYFSQGYSERDIPNLILQHNLYGLDIDDRACQLAYFALMMKARGYNRRFFRQDNVPQPMVYAMPGRKWFVIGLEKWLGVSMSEDERKICFEDLKYLVDVLGDYNGKTIGSALKIEREIDYERLRKYVNDFAAGQIAMEDSDFIQQAGHYELLIDIAIVLARKYDAVVTNPPYMTPAPSQADWIKKNYPDSKSDLCVVFIERNFDLLKQHGYLSMITMHSWMFLSSYEKFREKLIGTKNIVNMAHLGARAFEEIGGEVVQTTAFVMGKAGVADYAATYARLVDYAGQQVKEDAFLRGDNKYTPKIGVFAKIPGYPVAYWLSERLIDCFDNPSLSEISISDGQTKTGNNDKYLRLLWEVESNKIGKSKKWVIHAKGGSFRRWFGNIDTLIDWSDKSREHYRKDHVARIAPEYVWFRKGLSWTLITSSDKFAVRLLEDNVTFNLAAPSIFINDVSLTEYVIGFLNSPIAEKIMRSLNPTLNTNIGDVTALPLVVSEEQREEVETIVTQNIAISRTDWDSFETSWDFKLHPLIERKIMAGFENSLSATIEEAFNYWERHCEYKFNRLKTNEKELNRIFIEIYGLQEELTPEVEDRDVTVRKADLGREIRSLISYAVGCMFGRYSLDEPGLVFAGGKFDMSHYTAFKPVEDNIIPINHAEYFDNDIVARFVEFIRAAYGESTLSANLTYIADALYPNDGGTDREGIRRYFLTDFYKDHVKIYQKRPIYWQFDGGKRDGFKALFYLHRYDKFTVARARTDYLHPLQRKYDAEIKQLEMLSSESNDTREKAAYGKTAEVLRVKMSECRAYDQVIAHIAHQQITLDLDDGVKVNYAKFQGVEVPQDGGGVEKMDLLGKI